METRLTGVSIEISRNMMMQAAAHACHNEKVRMREKIARLKFELKIKVCLQLEADPDSKESQEYRDHIFTGSDVKENGGERCRRMSDK